MDPEEALCMDPEVALCIECQGGRLRLGHKLQPTGTCYSQRGRLEAWAQAAVSFSSFGGIKTFLTFKLLKMVMYHKADAIHLQVSLLDNKEARNPGSIATKKSKKNTS